MTITKTTQISKQYGTARYEVQGTNLTVEGLEKKFAGDGPFGVDARVYFGGTSAEVICYYD